MKISFVASIKTKRKHVLKQPERFVLSLDPAYKTSALTTEPTRLIRWCSKIVKTKKKRRKQKRTVRRENLPKKKRIPG